MLPPRRPPPAPIFDAPRDGAGGPLTFRRAGERCLLVEFGEPLLDLRSRVRVQLLRAALEQDAPAGLLDLTPGVRSLHIQHEPERLQAGALLRLLVALEQRLPPPDAATVPGRVVHLPLAWRDPLAMSAVARYEASVRADAPWCPDNIEFIRRMNGLADEEAVREVVFGASYLVLGLGDVYMGAPVAVPLDPRHRLVTTKYNPARTWTPANAVGIGGAFLCVYGMEGPGGYQLVGRTVPIWHDGDDPPWRLRHFDELRFEPVAADAARRAARRQPGRNVGAARRAGGLLAGRARALRRRQRRRHRGVSHAARDRVRRRARSVGQGLRGRMTSPTLHELPATPATVHWGYFDPSLEPVLTVRSGDLVRIEALTHHAGDAPDLLMDEGIERVFAEVDDRGPGPHLLTGPIAVAGARPGDTSCRSTSSRRARGCTSGRTSPATGAICTRTSARSA